jgi:hypothetical protein
LIVSRNNKKKEEEPHFQLFTLSLSYSLPLLFFGKFLDTNTKTTTTTDQPIPDPRSNIQPTDNHNQHLLPLPFALRQASLANLPLPPGIRKP